MSIAIVTGASSGIGKELVRRLSDFATVEQIWVIARREERLIELGEELGIPIRPLALDLAKKESLELLKTELEKANASVSVLINCAGYGKFGSYEDITPEDSLGMIDLNARALVGVTEATLPYMENGSKILQVCSISAFLPLPLMNVYSASKVFVLHYSRALSIELKARGISVTALCPGWVDTAFFATATDTKNPNAVTKYSFMQTPERVANYGLKAMKKGKLTAIVGWQNKILYVLTRILPVKPVMKLWLLLQK